MLFCKVLGWVPKDLLKILDLILLYFQAFRLQEVFHHRATTKVMFSGEESLSIQYPVSGYIGLTNAAFQGVAY